MTAIARCRIAGAVLASALATNLAIAGQPDTSLALGRHLAEECATCHKLDGGTEAIPSITGRGVDDVVKVIGHYRDGSRTNPVMVSVAQSLSEAEIAAVAHYLATLPRAKTAPAGEAAN